MPSRIGPSPLPISALSVVRYGRGGLCLVETLNGHSGIVHAQNILTAFRAAYPEVYGWASILIPTETSLNQCCTEKP